MSGKFLIDWSIGIDDSHLKQEIIHRSVKSDNLGGQLTLLKSEINCSPFIRFIVSRAV